MSQVHSRGIFSHRVSGKRNVQVPGEDKALFAKKEEKLEGWFTRV